MTLVLDGIMGRSSDQLSAIGDRKSFQLDVGFAYTFPVHQTTFDLYQIHVRLRGTDAYYKIQAVE